MKRNSYTPSLPLLLLAFLLLSSSFFAFSASARVLLVSPKITGSSDDGETELVRREDQKAAATAAADHFGSAASLKEEDFSMLMGVEELENGDGVCEEKDEDCLNRRIVAEAHLDYIYTQNHKNP